MAVKKTNADYKRDQYARKKAAAEALGIVDKVLPLPASINAMLNELCERHEFTDWRELVINMIRVAHAGAHDLAAIPPSGFVPSEAQLRKVGKRQVCTACGDDGFVMKSGMNGQKWTEECTECEGVE